MFNLYKKIGNYFWDNPVPSFWNSITCMKEHFNLIILSKVIVFTDNDDNDSRTKSLMRIKIAIKGAAHLWGLFFHHFFSFRNFYFTILSFLHHVVWLLKYKRKFFWKILVTPRWVIAGRMVNNFFLVSMISHVWMIWNSKSIFILKKGMNDYRP